MRKDDQKPVTQAILQSTLVKAFADFGRAFGREMRDFVRQEIHASEIRIKTEILTGVAEIIDGGINPQLDNHETRIVQLEAKA